MKRYYFGIFLLIFLLVLSLMGNGWAGRRYRQVSDTMAQAREHMLREDWETAQNTAAEGKRQWESFRLPTAALTDHAPMERIDMLFSQLEVALRTGDGASWAEICDQICQELQAMAEEHSLSWRNIL